MRHVIRADLDLLADPARRPRRGRSCAAPRSAREPSRTPAKAPERQAFPPPAPIPAWARASGRAGQGDPLFAAGAGLALLDAFLRRDPPSAGALRARLALQSAAASAKILRLNADEGALRDLRFAVGDALGPAANLLVALARSRRPAAQPRPRPDLRRGGAARPGLSDPNGLAASLKACAGEGDPVSAAAKAAALAFCRLPGRPSGRSRNPRPLGVRPRPRHPAALAAARAADRRRKSWIRPCGRRAADDGQGRATQPGQTPPQARSRSPPPPPSTSPPIFPAAPTP